MIVTKEYQCKEQLDSRYTKECQYSKAIIQNLHARMILQLVHTSTKYILTKAVTSVLYNHIGFFGNKINHAS